MVNVVFTEAAKEYLKNEFDCFTNNQDSFSVRAIELSILRSEKEKLRYSLFDIEITDREELNVSHFRLFLEDINLNVYILKKYINYFDGIEIDIKEKEGNRIFTFSKVD